MPDPALSTGYGQHMLDRGWGQWGGTPYTDILALTDVALARPDIDGDTVALMGGSYGGYMANWVAGHTDRFKCIVTHASLWELVGFHGTTDHGPAWEHEMGNPYEDVSGYLDWSPREFLAAMAESKTPMLVIHGEKDHRVPISEARTCGPTCSASASRDGSCTSRTRTTGSSSRRTRGSGTGRCSRSSTSTCAGSRSSGTRSSAGRGAQARSTPSGPSATSASRRGTIASGAGIAAISPATRRAAAP